MRTLLFALAVMVGGSAVAQELRPNSDGVIEADGVGTTIVKVLRDKDKVSVMTQIKTVDALSVSCQTTCYDRGGTVTHIWTCPDGLQCAPSCSTGVHGCSR